MKTIEHGPFSLKNLERFALLMDDRFRLPLLNIRVGWDFILGLIPVAGDVLTALASLYILVGAWRQGAGGGVLVRMLGNVGLDLLLGAVPLLGDLLDAHFRANKRNLRLLLKDLRSRQQVAGQSGIVD